MNFFKKHGMKISSTVGKIASTAIRIAATPIVAIQDIAEVTNREKGQNTQKNINIIEKNLTNLLR